MNRRVLIVDDDKHLLSALSRQLHREFEIATASDPHQALALVSEQAPFAVIVADMQMPGMSGIGLLVKLKESYPDSVRLMLTGKGDLHTAMEAVNTGSVFRFLTKPCPAPLLKQALAAGIEQYRLVTAERELLQGTLNGAIELLTDMLSTVAPQAFGDALKVKGWALQMAQALQLPQTWELEMAAMLGPIALVTLPTEVLARYRQGLALSEAELDLVEQLPATAFGLLRHIPRLEAVARIVRYENQHFDGSGYPRQESLAGEAIPLESRILHLLLELARADAQDIPLGESIAAMAKHVHRYDPQLVALLQQLFTTEDDGEAAGAAPVVSVALKELRPGQTLVSPIETNEGRLLLGPGQRLTATLIERLRNHALLTPIQEPIKVTAR